MAHFNLRYFLETLGTQKGADVCVVQIGAMDGRTFDPVHEFIHRFQWHGLLVEPMPHAFSALEQTYAGQLNIRLAQTAIAEQSGKVPMHYIPDEAVQQGLVPKWGGGAASLYPDRNALNFPEVQPHRHTMEVPATTLPQLLDTHHIDHIDVLQIDAEGHDYHILRQLDFSRFRPRVINFEIVNLPKAEANAAKRLLDEQGYLHSKAGYDLLCVDLSWFKEWA